MTDVMAMALDDIITNTKKEKREQKRKELQKKKQGSKPHADQPKHVVKGVSDKLVVSNLAHSVTQADVKELFDRIGPVKSAQLNYDQNGKSKGVATVIFRKSGDAARACSEYNNRTLDDRPMRIELIVNPESLKDVGSGGIRLGPKQGGGGIGKRQARGGKRGGRGGRSSRAPKKPLDAQTLDAEMDAYMADETIADTTNLANALA